MLETGDDSGIALDLEGAVYTAVRDSHIIAFHYLNSCWQVVRYGGKKEYDAVKAIFENPRTPTTRQAAV